MSMNTPFLSPASPSPSPSSNFNPSPLRSDVQSPAPSTSTAALPISAEERPEPQASSTGPDAAHQRIRRLRRSIVELGHQEAAASNSISPGHEAILLTGHPQVAAAEGGTDSLRLEQAAWNRLNAILPPAAMERLRQFEATSRPNNPDRIHQFLRWTAAAANMHPLDTTMSTFSNSSSHVTPSSSHPTTSSQSPSLLTSPLSPPRQRLLPPRTLQDPLPLRTRDTSDDPNTLIGRRVAAREASGVSNSLDRYITEQNLEYIRNLNRQRLSEPALQRRIESSLDAIRQRENYGASRSLDNPGQTTTTVSAGAPIRGQMRRALRTSRIESRQSSGNNSTASSSHRDGRLSILSNFSVQNLPTPSSTTSSQRLILFDEPASYNSPEESRLASTVVNEVPGRSYVTTRRLNAEGDEYVHNINGDDITFTSPFVSSPVQIHPENSISSGPSRRESLLREHRRDNTVRVSDYVVPASTLFGVVLDRDGNEIPPEEQPLLRSYETQPTYLPPPPPDLRWLSDPSSIHPPDPLDTVTIPEVEEDHFSPRVRINASTATGSMRDPELINITEDPQQYQYLTQGSYGVRRKPSVKWIGTNKPLFIDPLPMPVESMGSSSSERKRVAAASSNKRRPRETPIPVSKNACFAGR
ncbi:hypothetical protein K435DRAFT_866286 [Dendrothele bispora CBS 962.96]|uniref:Uncharacterized protein n=1 Tax=Dendrothele bispora (strain CBS 962.96) TaxID=1314807 RepID=A0A4S8LI37_DENBC|nr:hypothetical protein K435DRAFT_866286 [Dendrothele bispora CBS 962.96]